MHRSKALANAQLITQAAVGAAEKVAALAVDLVTPLLLNSRREIPDCRFLEAKARKYVVGGILLGPRLKDSPSLPRQ